MEYKASEIFKCIQELFSDEGIFLDYLKFKNTEAEYEHMKEMKKLLSTKF